jgi:hypothetical protein
VFRRLHHLVSEEKARLKKVMQKTKADPRSTEVKEDRKRLTIWAVSLIVLASVAAYILEPESLKYFLEFLHIIITSLVL